MSTRPLPTESAASPVARLLLVFKIFSVVMLVITAVIIFNTMLRDLVRAHAARRARRRDAPIKLVDLLNAIDWVYLGVCCASVLLTYYFGVSTLQRITPMQLSALDYRDCLLYYAYTCAFDATRAVVDGVRYTGPDGELISTEVIHALECVFVTAFATAVVLIRFATAVNTDTATNTAQVVVLVMLCRLVHRAFYTMIEVCVPFRRRNQHNNLPL